MAMLNVSEVFAAHMRAKSPEAKTENKVVTTVFSKEVDEVSTNGVTAFTEGSAAANKAEKSGDLTPEDAKLIKDTLRDLMTAKAGFAVDFYKG
jgi:hypothetical protein